jgi:hypothetical protein
MERLIRLPLAVMTTEQLGHIIKESLVQHRFVVLPEVGAFLLRKLPARIHPVHDRIEPPKDVVRFNEAIKDNDGMLLSKIGIESEVELKGIVAKIQFDFAKKVPVDFGPLGVLKKNYDGKLIFTEGDLAEVWPSHFGLGTVRLKPLEAKKKVNIKQLVPSGKKLANEFPVKKALSYAAALALMVSMGIIPMTNENNRNMASMSFASFLGNPVEANYTPRSYQPLGVSASYISEEPVSEKPDAPIEKKIPVEEPVKAKIEESEFFVIAGAFSSKSNATKLINDLDSRGFGGVYVGLFDGKHLVSYGSYSSLSDARGMRASVQLGNPGAWVLAGR